MSTVAGGPGGPAEGTSVSVSPCTLDFASGTFYGIRMTPDWIYSIATGLTRPHGCGLRPCGQRVTGLAVQSGTENLLIADGSNAISFGGTDRIRSVSR